MWTAQSDLAAAGGHAPAGYDQDCGAGGDSTIG